MKNFLKTLLRPSSLFLLLVFTLAIVVRFYNFPNRVTFWSEQARSLIVSGNYIKDRPTLLGQEYFRVDSLGHKMFSGAIFNYSLVPILLVSNYDPIIVTSFFSVINLITGFVIYILIKQMVNQKMATISLILFLFNDYMIYHSLFIWNYNLLPLVGILAIYFSYLNIRYSKPLYLFLLGLVSGLGVSIQILYIPFVILTIAVNFYKTVGSNKKDLYIKGFLLFVFGIILGNLPMVIFDLRHDYYHFKTLTQYFLDTLSGKSDANLAYYYFLPLWPAVIVFISWILSKFEEKKLFIILLFYIYVNLSSPLISWHYPTGMPRGLVVKDIEKAAGAIAKDASSDFNVTEVLDFDKRAYVLRYFITFKNNKRILNDEIYNNINLLYVLSPKDYNIAYSDIWEIKSGLPYNVSKLVDIGEGYVIYKLSK